MKQRYLTPTERYVAALKNASAQLHELRILFGAKSDPTFYRRLKAEHTYSPCMGEVLNPIFHYLVNPFYPLDPECIELKAVFSEYQKGLHDFILNDLTHALSGSETPDDICDSLNRCYEILSKTMFNPQEPKAHDEYDELCDLFDKASDEMRERIRQNQNQPIVVVDGFTPQGKKELSNICGKPKRKHRCDFRTQEEVATDTGFTRKTINKWEKEQTSDDKTNTSNPYGYYKSLRTDPKNKAAYLIFVRQVKDYKSVKGRRMSFVRFVDEWWKHNPDAVEMLHLT